MSAAECPDTEEQQDEAESSSSPNLPQSQEALIELRIQKLYNRRFLLEQIQQVTKAVLVSGEDGEEPCELDVVQRELDELLRQRESAQKDRPNGTSNGVELDISFKAETPEGGIYTLPPLPSTLNIVPLEVTEKPTAPEEPIQEEDAHSQQIQPLETLGRVSAFTQCPSCNKLVVTQTKSVCGDSMCLICCLCFFFGCFVGMFIIPFMDRLKDVQHRCPQCRAIIQTFRPM